MSLQLQEEPQEKQEEQSPQQEQSMQQQQEPEQQQVVVLQQVQPQEEPLAHHKKKIRCHCCATCHEVKWYEDEKETKSL